MTVTEPARAAGDTAGEEARARRRWAAAFGVVLLAITAVFAYEPLGARALINDPGIQYHLSERTARGAVPLLDFEHGWNAGAWYYGALLHFLAGGNPDVWMYLWSTVTGSLLAGVAVLAAGWRLRLGAAWLLALVGATLVLTSVVHAKYAVPAVWLLLLLPTDQPRSLAGEVALRAGGAAVVGLAHVELGVLLAVGTALYDLVGARDLSLRDRLLRGAAAPAGLLAGLGLQLAAWTALGLAPGAFMRQLVGTPTEIDPDFHFGYPLFSPRDLRMLLFPASLFVAFVPAIWRRLSEAARLTAFLHLALGLIALRRTDASHVAAATTLLATLAVLGTRDLVRAGTTGTGPVRWSRRRSGRAAGAFVAGAGWTVLAVLAGFRLESLLAITVLTVVCLAGVAASQAGDRPWTSLGAIAAAAGLVLASLAGAFVDRTGLADRARSAGQAATPQEPGAGSGDLLAARVAAEVRGPLEACTAGDSRVWVVPYPLGLYSRLGIDNPTPFVMFWYPFRGEHDRVRDMVEAGQIPAILVFNRWPQTFAGLDSDLEARYDLCAEVHILSTGDTVRIWTLASNAG